MANPWLPYGSGEPLPTTRTPQGIASQQGGILAASPSKLRSKIADEFFPAGLGSPTAVSVPSVSAAAGPGMDLVSSLTNAWGGNPFGGGMAPAAPAAPGFGGALGQQPQQQQQQYYQQPSYQSPTLQDYGMGNAGTLNSWLMGNYLNGPSNIAQQTTDAWAQQSNINANNAFRNRLLDTISGVMGGAGGGSGRMTGFQDQNSQQGAALPGTTLPGQGGTSVPGVGTVRTNITAQAPSSEMVNSATSALRNSQPAGGGDLANLRRDIRASGDNSAATSLDRALAQVSAQMNNNVQGATANQSTGMAGLLAGLQGDNDRYAVATQLPWLRALMGMVS